MRRLLKQLFSVGLAVAATTMLLAVPSAHAAPTVILTASGSDTTELMMDAILDTGNSATNGHYNIHAQQSPALTVPGDANCPTVTYSTPHTVASVVLTSGLNTATIAAGKQTATNFFQASDVGNTITDGTNGDITFGTTVATFIDASHVTLSAVAGVSATKTVTVATAPGSFNSPAGSSAGRRALRDSVNGIFPTSTIGAATGCVDIGRSSADANVPGGTDNGTAQYYAYALDVVNWSSPSLQAPASMTLQQLRDIYNCKITQWNELPGGGAGQIQRVLAQTNSGTEASYLARVLGAAEGTILTATNQDPTPGSICPSVIQVEENHGNYLTDPSQGGNPALYQQMIYPYSNAKWVFQATNAANPSLDLRNGVRVGAITTTPGDPLTAAYAVRWSGSRFFLNNTGTAKALIATDGVITNGSTNVTSLTAGFKAADVGLNISGPGIPAGATIATFNSSTSIELSTPVTASSATGVSLTISGIVAAESNPNVTDATETRIFAGVRYMYNVLDTASPNYSDARAVVGFDPSSSSKSPLCNSVNDTDILSAGFLNLSAKTIGANTGVTCRIV